MTGTAACGKALPKEGKGEITNGVNGGGDRNITSRNRQLGLYIQDWQYLFTVALIAIVPVIVLFALIEKRLIGGLTAGSVK